MEEASSSVREGVGATEGGATEPKVTTRRAARRRVSRRVIDHVVQGVLIFASVFLAFWLTDYRVQVSERRATDAALAAVVNEVGANRDVLLRWAPYHRSVSERVEGALASGAEAAFDPYTYLNERGVFREILTYDSWELLRQRDVRLDLETRLAVNRVFRQQEYVDAAVATVVAFLNDRSLFDASRARENRVLFYRHITDLYYQQVAMIETYERFLERAEGFSPD
jgi:hypothetical protein